MKAHPVVLCLALIAARGSPDPATAGSTSLTIASTTSNAISLRMHVVIDPKCVLGASGTGTCQGLTAYACALDADCGSSVTLVEHFIAPGAQADQLDGLPED